jgi:hypothetical protein
MYKIIVEKSAHQIHLHLSLVNTKLTTKSYPKTVEILNRQLPGIFSCKCFNNEKRSFRKEAKNTEVGHLFEHILMENLINLHPVVHTCRGETRWDWQRNPLGTFEIELNTLEGYQVVWQEVLLRSMKIFDAILASGN